MTQWQILNEMFYMIETSADNWLLSPEVTAWCKRMEEERGDE